MARARPCTREAGVGDFQRCLDAGNAAADYQRGRVDGHVQRFERLIVDHPFHTARKDGFRFFGGRGLVGMHPGNLLTDGDQLAKVRVQPGPAAGNAESIFVQVG